MILDFKQHTLHFLKPAKTSRGSYIEKKVWVLELSTEAGVFQAEVAPLVDLSTDGTIDYTSLFKTYANHTLDFKQLEALKEEFAELPSLRFGIDVLLKKVSAKKQLWVDSDFTQKKKPIKINGLVWMNGIDLMEKEADENVKSGFDCIKFKIGALDFDEECNLLERFRKKHPPEKVELRLDANGAFHPKEAFSQMKDLSRFHIHSIEQPIAKGQFDDLARLCKEGALPIALDEELIGFPHEQNSWLLKTIKPQYLVLKPTLIGGLDRCDAWISLCNTYNIGWWSTSALEGNVGLLDITQWVSQYPLSLPQGLGTGSLFKNNFPPSTYVENGNLYLL
jgi:O-succinylbenzoate synthase